MTPVGMYDKVHASVRNNVNTNSFLAGAAEIPLTVI